MRLTAPPDYLIKYAKGIHCRYIATWDKHRGRWILYDMNGKNGVGPVFREYKTLREINLRERIYVWIADGDDLIM